MVTRNHKSATNLVTRNLIALQSRCRGLIGFHVASYNLLVLGSDLRDADEVLLAV